MEYIVCHIMIGGKVSIQLMGIHNSHEAGFTITFPLFGRHQPKSAAKIIAEAISTSGIEWLKHKNSKWYLDAKLFKETFDFQKDNDWLEGLINVEMEHDIKSEYTLDTRKFKPICKDQTMCKYIITPELVSEQLPKKIFLSHKGIDKPTVRLYQSVLQTLGFIPWLDEDDMVAGTELERGLLQGFKDSCAAVFFVTSNYVDAGFLATEINYAVKEKRDKGNRFAIITLAFPDDAGGSVVIPELLEQYVWKTPQTPLAALEEIVRALPIELGSPDWKT